MYSCAHAIYNIETGRQVGCSDMLEEFSSFQFITAENYVGREFSSAADVWIRKRVILLLLFFWSDMQWGFYTNTKKLCHA